LPKTHNRPLAIRRLSRSSPIIETAMIRPRRLVDQPAHRWLRAIVDQVTKGIGSGAAQASYGPSQERQTSVRQRR